MSEQAGLAWGLVVLLLTIVVGMLLGSVLEGFKCSFLPESGGFVLIGLLVGGIAKAAGGEVVDALRFPDTIFLFVLLPPIILDSAITIRKRAILKNVGTILLLAVLGTIFFTFVYGGIIFGISQSMQGLNKSNVLESFLFAAIVAAVDPVAVFAILNKLIPDDSTNKKPPLLMSLIFGESVFNDAVAIVLYKSLKTVVVDEETRSVTSSFVGDGVKSFLANSFAALGIGLLWGVIVSISLKFFKGLRHSPAASTVCIYAFSGCSYLMAEAVGFSGIISVFITGFMITHYAAHNMTDEVEETARSFIHTVAMLAEAVTFVYIGMTVFVVKDVQWNGGLIAVSIVICISLRFLQIIGLVSFANCFRKDKVSFAAQIFMSFAGLRGAISFALAFDALEVKGLRSSDQIFTTTVSVVLFTTFIMGGSAEVFLKCLGLVDQSSDTNNQVKKASKKEMTRGKCGTVLYNLDRWIKMVLRTNDDLHKKKLHDIGEEGSHDHEENGRNRTRSTSQETPTIGYRPFRAPSVSSTSHSAPLNASLLHESEDSRL